MTDKLADAIYEDPTFRQVIQRIARDGSVVDAHKAAIAAAAVTHDLINRLLRVGTEPEVEVVEDEVPAGPDRYVAVAARLFGTLEKWQGSWDWSGEVHATRRDAILQGLKTFGSDDFLVGFVDPSGRVTKLLWMEEDDREQDDGELAGVTEQLLIPAATP